MKKKNTMLLPTFLSNVMRHLRIFKMPSAASYAENEQ